MTVRTLLRFLGEYSSRDGFLRLSLRIIRAAANAMLESEQFCSSFDWKQVEVVLDEIKSTDQDTPPMASSCCQIPVY